MTKERAILIVSLIVNIILLVVLIDQRRQIKDSKALKINYGALTRKYEESVREALKIEDSITNASFEREQVLIDKLEKKDKKLNQIGKKYEVIYKDIDLAHDSIQLNITRELLSRHRQLKFTKRGE